MRAPTGLEGGRQGSPAGWRSSVGAAAPSRYRGGRGHSRSWRNLLADPEPLSWWCPVCWTGSARAKTSGCGGTGQRRRTEMVAALLAVQTLFFCYPPAGAWCRCNICCTSSRLYGGSSLLWCMLSGDWNWGQWNMLSFAMASGTIKTAVFIVNQQLLQVVLHDSSCLMKDSTAR